MDLGGASGAQVDFRRLLGCPTGSNISGFQVGTEERNGQAGDTILAPKGIPHTYRVDSNTGRWLTVTTHEQFEEFVRAMARAPDAKELPPFAGPPSQEAIAALTETAKRFGIEIVGPPMQ